MLTEAYFSVSATTSHVARTRPQLVFDPPATPFVVGTLHVLVRGVATPQTSHCGVYFGVEPRTRLHTSRNRHGKSRDPLIRAELKLRSSPSHEKVVSAGTFILFYFILDNFRSWEDFPGTR